MFDHLKKENLWLMGCGPMAINHALALQGMKQEFISVGRGAESAAAFQEKIGVQPILNGIDGALAAGLKAPAYAIVVIDHTELSAQCCRLIDLGVKHILLEKPAGMDLAEVEAVAEKAENAGAKVYVAYNRRFYASVQKAKEIIAEDGGVTSFNFEFTEWGHTLVKIGAPKNVMDAIFLINSSHPIDLAFYLGGEPREISCYQAGDCTWSDNRAAYAGAGRTDSGAIFCYQANWDAPGRWSVEILTKGHRLVFRPLEKLQIQQMASVAINPVEIDDSLDTQYKAGLYLQNQAFLQDDEASLLTIEKHVERVRLYDRMRGAAE